MSPLPTRLLLHPSEFFSDARPRAGWLVALLGYYCISLPETSRYVGEHRPGQGLLYVLLWSPVSLVLAIAVLAVGTAFAGSRLLGGTASLARTFLVIGWAALWPGIVMCLSILLFLAVLFLAGTVPPPVAAAFALPLSFGWVWYFILSVKAIRALNAFTTGRAVRAASMIWVLLLLVVLWQYFAGVRPTGVPAK